MVLPGDSRFWLRSYGLTVTHKIHTVNWYLIQFPSLVFNERYFHVFVNRSDPNWSWNIVLMQIGKFQINYCNQRNISKKKMGHWRCPLWTSLLSVKSIFLGIEDPLYVLKTVLLSPPIHNNCSFLNKIFQFLNIEEDCLLLPGRKNYFFASYLC